MLQELFLRSPCPTAALQMRKDLQQWPQALSLAHQLDPLQVAPIACKYAQVCPFNYHPLHDPFALPMALSWYQHLLLSPLVSKFVLSLVECWSR